MPHGIAGARPKQWGPVRIAIEQLGVQQHVDFEWKDRSNALTSTQRCAEYHRYERAFRNNKIELNGKTWHRVTRVK